MSTIDDPVDTELIERILGDFREMPGMCLTLDQARRLWGCDHATCERVVSLLVARRILGWSRNGLVIRAGSPSWGRK